MELLWMHKETVLMKAYERLLQYAAVDTASDGGSTEIPSTPGQTAFARTLAGEMSALGIQTRLDRGTVYGIIPANVETDKTPLGFIAHMDTVSAAGPVRPRVVKNYDGGDIVLNKGKNLTLRPADYPDLSLYTGDDLIVTDGNTVLGADDKAGIAEILTAAETILRENIPHRSLALAFTPDEEIGRGADNFDVKGFGAPFAYTVDGGKLGEIEYENFNAATATVTVNGFSIHPGSAKNKMKNAALMAMEFNALLPANEIPACTEGYEGFHHLSYIQGGEEKTTISYIIRDHSREKFEEKKVRFSKAADYLNGVYGPGSVEIRMRDTYYNMKEKILPHMFLIDDAEKAMRQAGVTPATVPVRGGTDGAVLSYKGLPCPNLSTGGHNWHSVFEYIPVRSMEKMTEVLIALAKA